MSDKTNESCQPSELFIEELGQVSGGFFFRPGPIKLFPTPINPRPGPIMTTLAVGEEDGGGIPITTMALGEEDGGRPSPGFFW